MQKIESPKTVTIDGKEFPVVDFSETVQRLVAIHTEWRNQLAVERLAVAKTEAAIRALDAELSQTVGKEVAEKAKVEATVSKPSVAETTEAK